MKRDLSGVPQSLVRAVDQLTGLAAGLVADKTLNDLEILALKQWMAEHAEITHSWPGLAVQRKIDHLLVDGVITDSERQHLLQTLTFIASANTADFFDPVRLGPGVTSVDILDLTLRDVRHCGDFLFGSRVACERATRNAGGLPVDQTTARTQIVVVGGKVEAPAKLIETSREIHSAIALRSKGNPIAIISEQRWLTMI